MKYRGFLVKFTSIIFLLFFICSALISCKSTEVVSQDQNQMVQAPEDEVENQTEMATQAAQASQEPPPSVPVPAPEPAPQLTVEEERELKKATLTMEQRKFYSIKYTYDYNEIGCDLDYKIMVNDEDKEVIIQFEETDSDEDWKNNYLIFPWPLKLDNRVVWTTYGYAKIYKSAENIPIDEFYNLIQKYPDYKIVIWGWSLGSAMAKIIARHLTIRTGGQIRIDELTTFGDVKCWLNPFYSVKKYCDRIREYVNSNDMITWCMPLYRRDVKCRVGDRFNFSKLKNSEFYHTHYEDCDFSKWGDVSPTGEPINQK